MSYFSLISRPHHGNQAEPTINWLSLGTETPPEADVAPDCGLKRSACIQILAGLSLICDDRVVREVCPRFIRIDDASILRNAL